MSENEENQAGVQNEAPEVNTLDELFSDRDEGAKRSQSEKTEKVSNQVDEKEQPRAKQSNDKDKAAIKDKDTEQESPKKASSKKNDEEESEAEELRKKLEKAEQALTNSQKWGHSNSRKLKAALKKAQTSLEQGHLTEDEAQSWVELLQSEQSDEDEMVSNEDTNPLSRLIRIANKKVEDLREVYEDDKLFNKKLNAFDFFIQHASKEEVEDALDDLSGLENSPLKLAKKMYSIGEQYYNDFYKDFDDAGGFNKFAELKNKEIEKWKKEIDKLKKKLSQYEDHDKPTFRINELGGDVNQEPVQQADTLSEILYERDRAVRR